ncbi:hypothetical protein GT348_02350 [Aristophania vespae]|uniref:DAGKc domain-containing protein n=1 Tax=Aristophania vespae TaxID=2697033 RepID=A0A6P1NCL3_9PROT|nr:diacylglycerol kinase family protein [Aristophania vespae]QHI95268.1 hypothetical protein GT348_02350 [Aristophania vespae]UMM64520.1 Diacylglycerol kinase [Aristophania vespae]
MLTRYALLIVNPIAGHYSKRRLHKFVHYLQQLNWHVFVEPTHFKGHGAQLAQNYINSGTQLDLIIIGGGDGTISEIAQILLGQTIPLALFPIGSANVFARELNIDFNDRRNAIMISHYCQKEIWPAIVSSDQSKTIFIQMLGMGPDGWVVHNVSTKIKKIFGRAAYVLSTFLMILRYKFPEFSIFIDGHSYKINAAIISKGCFYGGNFQITAASKQSSKNCDAILFRCNNFYKFGLAFLKLLFCKKNTDHLEIITAKEIIVPASDNIFMQIDGDVFSAKEIKISISPHPLRLLVPKNNSNNF